MSLPTLTDEQRKAAAQKAIENRKKRTALKADLKDGKVAIAEVLGSEEEYVRKMRVSEFLGALPGLGKVRVAQLMNEIGIVESRRVGGLGQKQREALLAWARGR